MSGVMPDALQRGSDSRIQFISDILPKHKLTSETIVQQNITPCTAKYYPERRTANGMIKEMEKAGSKTGNRID